MTERQILLLRWGEIEREMDQLKTAERVKFKELVEEKEKIILQLHNLNG